MENFNKNFKQSNFENNERKTSKIITPFLSGVVGAGLVMGLCLGVPDVKAKLFNNSNTNNIETSLSSNVSSDLVDIVEYSNTSVAVAR